MPTSRFLALIFSFMLLALLPEPAGAGGVPDPPIEWGKIPPADLAMKSYPADTNAAAVVLCDYGSAEMNDDLGITFNRHVRIKILTKAGYEWGTFKISLYTKGKEEKISRIEGVTYNVKPDGGVEETELDDNSIFEEGYDNKFTRYSFTLPSLQPGCVIEVRYKITYKSPFSMPDWVFQKAIPVLWSEYRVLALRAFAYGGVKQGFEHFSVDETNEVTKHFSRAAARFAPEDPARCYQYRWVLRNAPALREEPFITTTDDYAQKMSLQLSEYVEPGVGVKQVIKTWDEFVKEVLKYDEEKIDVTGDVRKATEPLVAMLNTPEQKAAAIYNYVRSTIVWTGENREYAEKPVNDVLESRKGTSAEITVLFLSMLKHAGIPACPCILSTRANGKVQDLFPIASQFNYVVACVDLPAGRRFLDATDRYRPMDLLPTKVLNTRGLLIKEGPVEWVTLTTGAQQYEHQLTGAITVTPDGEASGSIVSISKSYAAVSRHKELQEAKEKEFARDLIGADRVSLTIDSVSVEGKDSADGPVTVRMRVSSPSYAQAAGDAIYLNPFIANRQYESPLKLPTRSFPVDMMYPRRIAWSFTFTIPEGYEVKEGAGDKEAHAAQDVTFSRSCGVNGRTITLRAELKIGRSEFAAQSYAALKTFYEKMTAIQAEPIMLQRRVAAAQRSTK